MVGDCAAGLVQPGDRPLRVEFAIRFWAKTVRESIGDRSPLSATTRTRAPDRRQRARAAALRAEINSPFLTFLMEAHSGLSAKIVEEAGFPGIWASGLSISASLGLRDSNEASWTQVLEVLEFMAES